MRCLIGCVLLASISASLARENNHIFSGQGQAQSSYNAKRQYTPAELPDDFPSEVPTDPRDLMALCAEQLEVSPDDDMSVMFPHDVQVREMSQALVCAPTYLLNHVKDKATSLLYVEDAALRPHEVCLAAGIIFATTEALALKEAMAIPDVAGPEALHYCPRKTWFPLCKSAAPIIPELIDEKYCPAILDYYAPLGTESGDWREVCYMDEMSTPDLCLLKLSMRGELVRVLVAHASTNDVLFKTYAAPPLICSLKYMMDEVDRRVGPTACHLPLRPPHPEVVNDRPNHDAPASEEETPQQDVTRTFHQQRRAFMANLKRSPHP